VPGSSSLAVTLPTFARCKRPGPLSTPYHTVHRSYRITMRAVAYTGATATASKYTFIVCRR
jgi:hypothetical protein